MQRQGKSCNKTDNNLSSCLIDKARLKFNEHTCKKTDGNYNACE